MKTLETNDPRAHAKNIEQSLAELIDHLRADADRVTDAKAQALFETSAEVLMGLRTAYQHYQTGAEKAMR